MEAVGHRSRTAPDVRRVLAHHRVNAGQAQHTRLRTSKIVSSSHDWKCRKRDRCDHSERPATRRRRPPSLSSAVARAA